MSTKKAENPITHIGQVERVILSVRGQRIMLDADLARIYGVTTKRLNEQVNRNTDRFPPDFMFRLTEKEKKEVVAICDHLRNLKYSPHLPYAFTEHGAIMEAIRQLMQPPAKPKREVGFRVKERKMRYGTETAS